MAKVLRSVLLLTVFVSLSVMRVTADERPFIFFDNPIDPCAGNCAISAFTGIYSKTGLGKFLNSSEDAFNSKWGGSGIFGIAASRRLMGVGDLFQIEGEAGLATRFGDHSSPEIWTALYFRWLKFPWDQYLDTSFAVSSGFNLALLNDPLEVARFGNGNSPTRLLHYFSPEITFALPSHPQRELFVRFHHRSGLAKINSHISKLLFNNAAAGADYATIGLRWKF